MNMNNMVYFAINMTNCIIGTISYNKIQKGSCDGTTVFRFPNNGIQNKSPWLLDWIYRIWNEWMIILLHNWFQPIRECVTVNCKNSSFISPIWLKISVWFFAQVTSSKEISNIIHFLSDLIKHYEQHTIFHAFKTKPCS